MKSITAFFISIALFFLNIFTPKLPAPKSDAELEQITSICQKHELSDKLYVIDVSVLQEEGAKHMAIALQGIVAKTKPCIFIRNNTYCNKYLDNCRQRNLRQGTINHYKQSYTQFYKFFEPETPIEQIMKEYI